MVSVITRFACDICKAEFDTQGEAAQCEARGKPEPLMQPGLVFTTWGFPNPMVFAAMSWRDEGHTYRVSCIAARDTAKDGAPNDNLLPGEGRCGFECYAKSETQHHLGYAPDTTLPAFQRLVAALREQGVEPVLQTRKQRP